MNTNQNLTIYIDGDSFPNSLKRILVSAVIRLNLSMVVVSNQLTSIDTSDQITHIIVPEGPDQADDRIVDMVKKDDLVITADIPLADRVISKKAYVIDHRGGVFNEANIAGLLATRRIMESMRESGVQTPGPEPFSSKHSQGFANQLNNFLTKRLKT